MPSLTQSISPKSELHEFILRQVRDRIKFSKDRMSDIHEKWRDAEDKGIAFIKERDNDAIRRGLREGGKPQYTTITIPYSYAVLMTAHTYWSTVFLSRNPVWQFTGRHGEPAQSVQAIEALMDYQLQVGEMLVPLYIWLYDVGKYGAGIIGTYWEDRFSNITEIVEEEEQLFGRLPTGRMKKRKITRRIAGYSGNRIYNVRPYDFLPDPRVPLAFFQKGEYCATYNELSMNEVLRREEAGYYMNIGELRKGHGPSFGERVEGSPNLKIPDPDDVDFGLGSIGPDNKKPHVVELYECYIDLIPDDWGLGSSRLPEKWVFTVTTDWRLVLGAQPLGAMHDKFPFQVLELEPEGYALVNRGIPEILEPVQNTLDWLFNSHFYNVRKVLNDQFVVDPSRIVLKDLQDPLPGGIIRLRPSAYGTKVEDAVKQLPVVDITRAHLKDAEVMFEIGQRMVGVSDQLMGVMESKGRRTAQESRTSATFGIGRQKAVAEFFSAQGWSPLSQMLLQNTQQYYEQEQQFRIVGDLARDLSSEFINVTPDAILGFYDFVPVDGTLPIDRFAQANLWREMLAMMVKIPPILERYDIGRIFEWVAQLAGLKNVRQFRVEVVPDAAAAAQAQAGNLVPIPTRAQPRNVERVSEPGQVSGLGTTG